MVHIGIDPGTTGALATLDSQTRKIEFYDTPTVTVKVGKKFKNQMNAPEVVLLLRGLSADREVFITIEKVNAMPGWKKDPGNPNQQIPAAMGVTSAFNFGFGFGLWIGIITALQIPFQLVHPITWKKAMLFGSGKEKDASRIKAMQLFPGTAESLKLKKHHGRADALLIAAWAMKVNPHVVPPSQVIPEFDPIPTLF